MNKCVLFVFFSDGLTQAYCVESNVKVTLGEMVEEMVFYSFPGEDDGNSSRST